MGNGRVPKAWAAKTPPQIAAWPIRAVGQAALKVLPFLGEPTATYIASAAWPELVPLATSRPRLLSLRLQAIEADAMTVALVRLWDAGVAAVPVHDSLIVPQRFERVATEELREACHQTYGVHSMITRAVPPAFMDR